jgi:hypothetical protein
MRFTFDLFNGKSIPNSDFIEWSPGWWYHTKGLPVKKGACQMAINGYCSVVSF